jgi:hypothetical protein
VQRARTTFGALIIGALLCSVVGGVSTAGALETSVVNSSRAAQLLNEALAAAGHQRSVHESSKSVQSDGSVVSFSSDLALAKGVQKITYKKSGITGHLTDVVLNGKAYFRGDSFSLVNFFGFVALTAGHIAGHWVSIERTSSAYAVVATDVTLPSAVKDIELPGVLAPALTTLKLSGPMKMDKISVFAITGKATVNGSVEQATLYVRAKGTPLPVAESQSIAQAAKKTSARFSFSKWNEPVRVPTPTHPTPFASLATS